MVEVLIEAELTLSFAVDAVVVAVLVVVVVAVVVVLVIAVVETLGGGCYCM